MSKCKKIAEIIDLSIKLVSLISFVAYFMFLHVVLAKEISKNKNLEFDISKAFNLAKASAIFETKSEVSAAAVGGEKINYKPSAVIAESANISDKTVNAAEVSGGVSENDITAYIPVSGNYKVVGKSQVYVTAYSSTPDQTDSTPFITASNKHVRDGIVAANWLPFGTKIKIPAVYADKIFVVEDRMNARYPHRADIWFPARQKALDFGIKFLDIEILAEN